MNDVALVRDVWGYSVSQVPGFAREDAIELPHGDLKDQRLGKVLLDGDPRDEVVLDGTSDDGLGQSFSLDDVGEKC